MARHLVLKSSVGERLLTSKLQILNGTGSRRPSLALSILTGRIEHLPRVFEVGPVDDAPDVGHVPDVVAPIATAQHTRRRLYAARTVYLSEPHLHDVDHIIETWQQVGSRRLTRSAVLRRAIEHLREAVDADPAKFLLEND